jgi:hypothetical protein
MLTDEGIEREQLRLEGPRATEVDPVHTDHQERLGWPLDLELRIVRREGVPALPRTEIEATCAISQDWATDCPELP